MRGTCPCVYLSCVFAVSQMSLPPPRNFAWKAAHMSLCRSLDLWRPQPIVGPIVGPPIVGHVSTVEGSLSSLTCVIESPNPTPHPAARIERGYDPAT